MTQIAATTTEPTLFIFKDCEVRTITIEDATWFVVADVCKALDIKNVTQAASRLEEVDRGLCSVSTLGGVQELTVVSEAGLYKLIFTSRKKEATDFVRWVTNEVLPSIRKTGKYETPEYLQKQSDALTLFKTMLEGYALTNTPVSFAQTEAAKRVLQQTGVNLLGTLAYSPGQEDIPEEEVLLAPRNLAYYLSDYFDYEIRDRDVNTLLYELGYQEPQRGNPSWVATAKGEPISYMAMFANAKGSGYHLKWNKLEVWDIFTQHQEAKNIKAKLAYEERRFQQEQQAAKEEHEAKVRQMERECAAKLYRPPVELEHFSLRRNG